MPSYFAVGGLAVGREEVTPRKSVGLKTTLAPSCVAEMRGLLFSTTPAHFLHFTIQRLDRAPGGASATPALAATFVPQTEQRPA